MLVCTHSRKVGLDTLVLMAHGAVVVSVRLMVSVIVLEKAVWLYIVVDTW
jgi:hypothetical protein